MAGRAAATARALSYAVPGAWAVRRRLSKRRHVLLIRVIAANRLNVQRTRLPDRSRRFSRVSRLLPQWAPRITVPRFGRTVAGVDLIVVLLVILIVLALVGSIAVSPLLWVLVIILMLFAVRGRGRYYGRRG